MFSYPVITRYFFRAWVTNAFITLMALLTLTLVFDFLDLVEDLANLTGSAPIKTVVFSLLLKLPSRVYESGSFVVLIASLVTLFNFSKSNEISLLRTSGLSTGDLVKMIALFSLSFSLLCFFIGDFGKGPAGRLADSFETNSKGGASEHWFREGKSFISVLSKEGEEKLAGLTIYQYDQNDHLTGIIAAKSATYQQDSWLLHDASIEKIGKDAIEKSQEKIYQVYLSLTPDLVDNIRSASKHLNVVQLLQSVLYLKSNRQSSHKFELEAWRRLLYPLLGVIMALSAIPFAVTYERERSANGRVFFGIIFGIVFYAINELFSGFGTASELPPFLIAMAPMLVFVLMLVAVTFYFEKR